VGFLVVWELASHLVGENRFPGVVSVAQEFVPILTHSPEIAVAGGGADGLLPHLLYSVRLMLAAGFVGIACGIGVGLLMGLSKPVGHLLGPPVEVFRAIPPLAVVPFFLIWLGAGPASQFLVVAIYCFLRLVVFTTEAIRNVPSIYQDYARTLGATRFQYYRTVILPGVLPELSGGIRVVIPIAWGITVAAELMGSSYGVGRLFNLLGTIVAANAIVTIIVWVTLVGALSDVAFSLLSRRLTRWQTTTKRPMGSSDRVLSSADRRQTT
jgi:ABC-type nitrate/sulfonate/bicarbonate transport system permease component